MILSLVPYKIFPPHTGGQKAISLFTEYLAKEIPITCVTVKSGKPDRAYGFKVLNILSDSRLRYINPLTFFVLRKLIITQRFTHLLIEHPYFGWLGILLKQALGIKLIVRSHNIESLRWKSLNKWWWKILYYYEKFVHKQSDYNLFITEDDRQYAIQQFHLYPEKCMTATFGTPLTGMPLATNKYDAAEEVKKLYNIKDDEHIFLFNGIFSYKPNADALSLLLYSINPLLLKKGIKFRLIICGKSIPQHLTSDLAENIILAGFVNDLSLYLNASDVFLNPITDGGGIKTKLVEALAHHISCVSFRSGAIGIPSGTTGSKLLIVPDLDVEAFCEGVTKAVKTIHQKTPDYFFEYFSWPSIIKRVKIFIYTW